MSQPDDRSFRKLLPGFVIPAGTQVVLKVAKVVADGQQFKPPGSVGIVLESPPANRQPYLVRFADGEMVTAHFHELALRRREVEDELGATSEDLRLCIIYRCQVGSKAFGLASDDSDDDLRGIYLPPARLHWSLRRLPEQLEFKEAERDESRMRSCGCAKDRGPFFTIACVDGHILSIVKMDFPAIHSHTFPENYAGMPGVFTPGNSNGLSWFKVLHGNSLPISSARFFSPNSANREPLIDSSAFQMS
jgi:hypothetical protein